MLLLPIRLYEPAAVFAVASPLIIATVAAASWIRRWRDHHHEDGIPLRPARSVLPAAAGGSCHRWRSVDSSALDVGHVGSIGHLGRARRHDRVAGLRLRREPLTPHFAPLLVAATLATARIAPNICGNFFAEQFIQCIGLGRADYWKGPGKLLVLEIVYAEWQR